MTIKMNRRDFSKALAAGAATFAVPGCAGAARSSKRSKRQADPAEQRDVAKQNPDVVKRLKALYEKTITQVPSFKRPKRFKQLRRIKGGSLEF